MDRFWRTYYSIEKTFFHSLTRKLASLALIVVAQLVILFAVYHAFGGVETILAQANIAKEDAPAEVLTQIEAFIGTIGQ